MDFVDVDHQQIGCFVVDHLPHLHDTLCPNVVVRSENLHRTRRRHPVQWLIAAAIRVNQHTAIALDHHDSGGKRKVGSEATLVVHGAGSDYEAHNA
jgi:hypothetical protein